MCGVISNSDDRVPTILSSLGLSIGSGRHHHHPPPTQRNMSRDFISSDDPNDIQFIILSYEVGAEKPDRPIFAAAEDWLKSNLAPPDEKHLHADKDLLAHWHFLHVGDDLRKDVFAARSAGWDSVLIDRQNRYMDDDFNAGDIITTQIDMDHNSSASSTSPSSSPSSSLFSVVEVIRDLTALKSWKRC